MYLLWYFQNYLHCVEKWGQYESKKQIGNKYDVWVRHLVKLHYIYQIVISQKVHYIYPIVISQKKRENTV